MVWLLKTPFGRERIGKDSKYNIHRLIATAWPHLSLFTTDLYRSPWMMTTRPSPASISLIYTRTKIVLCYVLCYVTQKSYNYTATTQRWWSSWSCVQRRSLYDVSASLQETAQSFNTLSRKQRPVRKRYGETLEFTKKNAAKCTTAARTPP